MVATGTFTTFPGQKAGFSPSSELKLRGLSNLQEKVLEEWVTKSGVTEEITRLNVLSIEDLELIASLLGWKAYKHTPGWALYSIDLATGKRKFAQFKPDVPVQFPDAPKPAKYLTSKSGYDAICLDTGVEEGYWQEVIKKPSIPITVPEGGKKAGALMTCGYASAGLCGVEMGLLKGGKKLVPNLEILAVPGRRIILTFDADIAIKEEVSAALKRLGKILVKKGCTVLVAWWDIALGKGIDDVLVNCGEDAVHDIMDKAIPLHLWINALEKQFPKNGGETVGGKGRSRKDQIPPADLVAKELAGDYRHKLKFNNETGFWMRYEADFPGVWSRETNEFVESMVSDLLDSKGIEGYDTNSYVVNVVKKLRHKLIERQWIERPANEFIPFENGVLEVATGKLLKHSPGYHFTWCIPRSHNPLAHDWSSINTYLEELAQKNQKLKEIYLCFANAVLKGRADLQKFVHLIGLAGSGKGTYARLITDLIGQENILSTTLEDWCNNRFESANGYRKRLIVFWDEDKQVGKLGKFLSLTGGDWIRGEQKNKQAFQYRFDGLCLVLSNMPIFTGSAASRVARRAITIPCNHLPPKNQIRDLNTEFQSSLDAFTNYVLSIPDERVEQVLKGLADTPECTAEFWENRMRTDAIAAWVNEWVVQDVTAQTLIGMNKDESFSQQPETLYGSYSQFCRQAGLSAKSHVNFSPDLIELCNTLLGWEVKKVHTNKGKAIKGLRLRGKWDDPIPTHDAALQSRIEQSLQEALEHGSSEQGGMLPSPCPLPPSPLPLRSLMTVKTESDGSSDGLSDGLNRLQDKGFSESDGLSFISCEEQPKKLNDGKFPNNDLGQGEVDKPSLSVEPLENQASVAVTETITKTITPSITVPVSVDYSSFPHLTCDTIEAKRNQAQRIKQELKEADSKEELTAIRQQYSTRCEWVWHNLLTSRERERVTVIAQTKQLSLFDETPPPSAEVYSPQLPKDEEEWEETVEEAVSMMKIFNQDVDKEGNRIYQDQEQLIETLKEYYRLEVLEEAERRLAMASTKCEILVIGGTVLDPTIEWIPAWLKDCPERFQQYWAFELESGEMKHIFGRFQWRLV